VDTHLIAYEAQGGVQLERIPRQFFTLEFKEEAVSPAINVSKMVKGVDTKWQGKARSDPWSLGSSPPGPVLAPAGDESCSG